MNLRFYFIEFTYLLAGILFILGLKGLSHPETAKRGMHLAEFGMLMAIVGTLLHFDIVGYELIITGLVIGSLVGGRIQDRTGPRPVALAGAALYGLGVMLASLVSSGD